MNSAIEVKLSRIKGSFCHEFTGKTGVKKNCICIPIENQLGLVTDGYQDKKNLQWVCTDVTLHLTAIEMKEEKFGQTHFFKPSFSREVFERMSEEEQRAYPVLGGIKPFAPKKQQSPAPQQSSDAQYVSEGPDW